MKWRLGFALVLSIAAIVVAYVDPTRAQAMTCASSCVAVFLVTEVLFQWRIRCLHEDRAEMWKRISEERQQALMQAIGEHRAQLAYLSSLTRQSVPNRLDIN